MKRWIPTLAAAALALGLAMPAAAAEKGQAAKGQAAKGQAKGQAGKGRAAGGMKRFKDAIGKLDLNAEQKSKVDRVLEETQAEAKKIQQGDGTPEEKRPKMQAVLKGMREKLSAILTPEQSKKLQEEMGRGRKAGAKPGAKPGAKKPGAK